MAAGKAKQAAGSRDLDRALQCAVSQPRYIRTDDGGAVLGLALHCLMVEDGFRVHAERMPEGPSNPFTPAAEWNGRFPNEWVFEFRRPGYASVFTLHCSLQAASGKMFVHAREADCPSNMRYMGLLVDRYLPDLQRCRQPAWAGVVMEQQALRAQLKEYIIEPLLEAALPAPEEDEAVQSSSGSAWANLPALGSMQTGQVLLGTVVLALAVAGAWLLVQRKNPPSS